MSIHDLFSESTRRRVAESVTRAEAQTSAELVVALRKASAPYRAADAFFAAMVALSTLIAMLFLPMAFPLWSFVFDVTIVFAAALFLAPLIPGLRRTLTPPSEREEMVHAAASAAFLGRSIHRCKARNGVLVYASVVEQAVEVIGDLAIDVASLEPARKATRAAMIAGDVEAFAKAIESFGAALAAAHPRQHDDVNELADDVV